ncbi:MAG: hypothetical protein IIT82_08745, partial [Selenomonas sp.]|nr:hypothetical protein [Selenomonas sp.]
MVYIYEGTAKNEPKSSHHNAVLLAIGFSGVPDGKVPVVSVTYGANNYEVFDIFDNGDGTFSFTMPDGNATVTASGLKNDIKSCEATV